MDNEENYTILTNTEYSDKANEYNYLLRQQSIRPLHNYELDRLNQLQQEIENYFSNQG